MASTRQWVGKWVRRVFTLWFVAAVATTIGYAGYTAYLLVVSPERVNLPFAGRTLEAAKHALPTLFCLDPKWDEMHMARGSIVPLKD